jgi:hypothetical protein
MAFLAIKFVPETNLLDLSDIWNDQFWRDPAHSTKLNFSSPDDVELLAKCLAATVPTLANLDLSKNRMRYVQNLEPVVKATPGLTFLKFEDNQVTNSHDISATLGKWKNLQGILVDNNPFSRDVRENDPGSVRKLAKSLKANGKFPSLVLINNQTVENIESTGFDIDTVEDEEDRKLPASKNPGLDQDTEVYKEPIQAFLSDYIKIYDDVNSGREGLLNFYHDKASFSMMLSFSHCSHNRDDPKVKTDHLKYKSRRLDLGRCGDIHVGVLKVVAALDDLPKTQHQAESMTFDVGHCSEDMIHLVFAGKLFEDADGANVPDGMYKRYFSRSLTIIPDESNKNGHGLLIINDILTIKPMHPDSDRGSSNNSMNSNQTVPTAGLGDLLGGAAAKPVLDQNQKAVLTFKFCEESGLNTHWAMQCLQARDWDYNQAAQLFIEQKSNGSITQEMMK